MAGKIAEGVRVGRDDLLRPYLRVRVADGVELGAPHRALHHRGVGAARARPGELDRRPGPWSGARRRDSAVAVYVDKYAVFGNNRSAVSAVARRIAAQLNSQKLPTREEVGAQEGGTSTALDARSRPASVGIKPDRVWRLRAAPPSGRRSKAPTSHAWRWMSS